MTGTRKTIKIYKESHMKKIHFLLSIFLMICFITSVCAADSNTHNNIRIPTVHNLAGKVTIEEFPSDLPYSAVALIESDYYRCSGFMIGPHYAVTLASCIYNKYNKFTDKVLVVPGSFGQNAKCGPAWGSYMYIMDTDMRDEYDVGVIEFDEDLGNCSGWFGYRQISSSEAHDWAKIIGYDEDMFYQFEASGKLQGFDNFGEFIFYNMGLTNDGDPGSPVLIGNQVVGIHFGITKDRKYEIGIRLTDKVLDFLKPYWGK